MSQWNPEPESASALPPCPRSIDVPAYLQDELPRAESASFRRHLARCPACRDEALEVQAVLVRLPRVHAPLPEVDLLPRILARVQSDAARTRAGWTRRLIPGAAAAAALLLFALGLSWRIRESSRREVDDVVTHPVLVLHKGPAQPDPEAAVSRALEWLAGAQEPSGRWSAERWGGQARFDVGLTSLALLALLDDTPTPEAVRSTARAVDFLLSEQVKGGRFGPEFSGSIYNHAIATVAIIETFGCLRDERLREPIGRAVHHLHRIQSGAGAWGYPGEPSSESNTAATVWPLQALLLARALGWKDLDRPIEAGFAYLARACDDAGRIGYRRAGDFRYGSEGPSSMGAFCLLLARDTPAFPAQLQHRLLDRIARSAGTRQRGPGDLYRDFFVSSALNVLPSTQGGGTREDVHLALAAKQVQEGPNRGTWEMQDSWASVGGRLYSTTLAALILRTDERGRRLTRWTGGRG